MALLVARRPRDGGLFNDCSLLRLCLDQQCVFVDEEFLSRLGELFLLRSKGLNSIRLLECFIVIEILLILFLPVILLHHGFLILTLLLLHFGLV
jgi:hypothetical protein